MSTVKDCLVGGAVILELLERFQTSLVGILGFTGVIITMVANAKIQRNLQSAQRQHKVQSLRTALLVELKENVRMFEDRISSLSTSDTTYHALIPSKVTNSIYQCSLSEVGLLSAVEVESVLRAYLLIEEMPYRLRLLVGTNNVGGYNDEFIRIDADRQHDAKKVHDALLPKLREAVIALERNS
jgi:hypothetical protein